MLRSPTSEKVKDVDLIGWIFLSLVMVELYFKIAQAILDNFYPLRLSVVNHNEIQIWAYKQKNKPNMLY